VEYEHGLAVARRIRASRYLGMHPSLAYRARLTPGCPAECSAKHDRGVREAFEEAARVAVGARAKGLTKGSQRDSEGSDFSSCWGCFG
jgi:Rho family protein